MKTKIAFLTAASLIGLGACTPSGVVDFYSPAGDSIDDGNFGNATMNNIQVMTGERRAIVNLSNRFADEVPSTVNFEFNKANLDAAAEEALRQQAAWIAQYPQVKFRVYGHTDLVGSDAYNKALGMRRARAAVNFLVSQGIERERLEAVVSYGETQPLIVTEGRERANRRTVTEVSGFIKPREQRLDGKYGLFIYDEYVRSAYEEIPGYSAENDPEANSEER
ncbi:OmpA family protein [Actibacterium sp. XHP0104]|uniref:OmpA family protein n=1 Tax=Actibacterium sp. XHP0104 TaxID=2984335 RepID=UPI0021E86AF6|nr:OmpA family protein [Actibacterium sp. XHP0104]MCV2880515.1 OmpA family protein [Actibacterium sp. XHP0104]